MKLGRLAIAVAYLTLMATVPAFSQRIAAPPSSGGLFGATRSDVGGRDRLTFLFDVSETRDSELPAEFRSRVPRDDLQSGGLSTMLIASTDYARNRSRVQLAGTGLTAFRYYQRLDRVAAVSHSAGLGASVRLPKQGSFQIAQSAAYSPSYWYQLFPTGEIPELGDSIPADPDYRIAQTDSYSYGTRMAVAFGSARRTRVTTTAEYNHTDLQRETAARPDLTTAARLDLTILSTGAKVSRGVGRHSGLSVEYEHRTGQFGLVEPTNEHRMTMGVEYSRALTVSRRAIFRVNVSPSILEVPAAALPAVAISAVPIALEGQMPSTGDGAIPNAMDRRLYRLQGDAGVEYPFRLNWRAAATYRRGVEYLAVLREPVFSNGARVQLTGVIRRRVDLLAVAGYATGASAIDRGASNLGTYTGEVRVRYALKRSFALYSQYLYYYYDLRGQARLAPDLPRVFEQHGIRVGFMLFGQALGK